MNIAYIRVSHIESLNGTSLDTQEKRCKAFAELHGFKIDKGNVKSLLNLKKI